MNLMVTSLLRALKANSFPFFEEDELLIDDFLREKIYKIYKILKKNCP